MSNTNYITEMLELKDNNIKFYENCYRKEKIKGIYYKVFDGVLSYKPTCCPKCGVIFDKKREKHGFITSNIKISEVEKPDMDSQVVATSIAKQIENRASYRRVIKKVMQTAMRFGIKGIKIKIGGRLNGAEIARAETYKDGSIPLHTLKADVDYATASAHTIYGIIGIKVWICKK